MLASVVLTVPMASSFMISSPTTACAGRRFGVAEMGFFDGLAAAFENDDTLGEAGPAGLKTRVQERTITWQGPPPEGMAAMFEKPKITEQTAIKGQPLKDLASSANVPLKYSCMKGTCGICDVMVDGVAVPACTAKMPDKDVTISYKTADQASAYMKEKLAAERLAKKAAKGAKAAPAKVQGNVVPTNPFGALPTNPFGNPFAQPAPPEPEPEPEPEPAKPTKGGWPFS